MASEGETLLSTEGFEQGPEWLLERVPLYRLAHGISICYGVGALGLAQRLTAVVGRSRPAIYCEPFQDNRLPGRNANPARVDLLLVELDEAERSSPSDLRNRLSAGGLLGVLDNDPPVAERWLPGWDHLGVVQLAENRWLSALSPPPDHLSGRATFGLELSRSVHGVLKPGSWRFPLEQWSLLVGRSGVGKTTLLQMIAGVSPLRGATVTVPYGSLFLLPQDPDLIDGVSVRTNIGLFSADAGTAESAASRLGLSKVLERVVDLDKPLSGGEYQRVAIAQAVAAQPSTILLDEPFSGLDFVRRAQMMQHFRQAAGSSPAASTVLCIAHDFEAIEVFFDNVFEIVSGRLHSVRLADISTPIS